MEGARDFADGHAICLAGEAAADAPRAAPPLARTVGRTSQAPRSLTPPALPNWTEPGRRTRRDCPAGPGHGRQTWRTPRTMAETHWRLSGIRLSIEFSPSAPA